MSSTGHEELSPREQRVEDAIADRACSEDPRLGDSSVPAVTRISLLRDWAFRHILVVPLGGGNRGLLLPADAWRLTAGSYLEVFDSGRAGALCGDAAWFLVRVYQAFGFAACTYNFGFDEISHVVTLVELDGRWVVQDAFFDFELRDGGGALVDIVAVLRALRDGDDGAGAFVRLEQEPFPTRDVLIDQQGYRELAADPNAAFVSRAQLSDCHSTSGGHVRCSMSDHRWGRLRHLRDFQAKAFSRLSRDGLPRDLDYLMLYPLGVASVQDGWVDAERAATGTTRTATLMRSIMSASRSS